MSRLAAGAGKNRRQSVSKVTADDGSVYFHDEETGSSTWEAPAGSEVVDHDSTIEAANRAQAEKNSGRRQSRLSDQLDRLRKTRAGGWETCLDSSTGKLYYWHRDSGKTQWSVPPAILEARKVAKAEQDAEKGARDGVADVDRRSSGNARKLWKRASFKIKTAAAFKKCARPRRRNVMGEGTDAHTTDGNEINIQIVEKPESSKILINASMEGNFVFQMLPKRVVRSMVDAMGAYVLEAGHEVIKQGDKGDYFYVIEQGECDVVIDGHNVATLGVGKSFGELALFYNCPRNASIISKTECYLWRIGRADFKSLMVNGAIADTSAAEEALAAIPFLQKLNKDQLGRVAAHCVLEEFAKDEKIITKGDHGDKFYIIKSGMVKCKIDEVNPALFLGPKKFFGERALLRDQPRAAHVIAARQTECLSLTRHAFHVLLGPIHEELRKEYSGSTPYRATEEHEHAPSRRAIESETKEEVFNHHNITLEELEMGPVLGEGTFGRVQLVTHQRTNTKWALKIMMKQQIKDMGQTKATMLEKDVMMKIRHPLCLRLEATFANKNLIYMMLEIVHGGELFSLLADSPTGVVPPIDARFYAACVVDAFSYLHGKSVVYRDLKPENLLIDKKGYLKVIDYGFAKFLDTSPYKTFTFCGTPEYFAPEMMAGQGYAHSVDTWGVGILIYEMVYGFTPFADFENNDPRKTMKYIMKNKVTFPADGIKDKDCENLILGLLTKDPDARTGCDENGIDDVKTHALYKGFDWDEFYSMQMATPWQPTLSGPDGVQEVTEEYDSFATYTKNVMKYKGSQKWCEGW